MRETSAATGDCIDDKSRLGHMTVSDSFEPQRSPDTEYVTPSRPFPVGRKFTRDMFDEWIDVVYPLALRGVFSAQLRAFAGAKVRWTPNSARYHDTRRFSGQANNGWTEAKHDALAEVLERVYDEQTLKNPILGHAYNSAKHLADRLRKIANGYARSRRREERPTLPTSTRGITPEVKAVIPDFSEAEPPTAQFDAKYLAYETATCPWCASEANRAFDLLAGITPNRLVPLKTRQCFSCGVAVPEGAHVQLAQPNEGSPALERDRADGYQRLWERAAGAVLRTAATEGRIFETLVDEHPYSAMMPLQIRMPRTSAMKAAWRAGAASARRRSRERYRAPADGGGATAYDVIMYGEVGESSWSRLADAMGLGPEDAYAAAPPSKVWNKRSPADRPPEPTETESLRFRVHRWRRVVEDEAHRIEFVNFLLAKGEIPSGMRRRRPDRTLPDWPTAPLPAAKLPERIQYYRRQAMRTGRHLLRSLDIIIAEAQRTGERPVVEMPALDSADFRTAANAGGRWLRRPPQQNAPYDSKRRIEHLAALTDAYRDVAYSIDLEAFFGEIRRRYAFTW